MICPFCKKENTLERYKVDPTLFGCTTCHSTYSETFLLGYLHGYIDRGNKPIKKSNEQENNWLCPTCGKYGWHIKGCPDG